MEGLWEVIPYNVIICQTHAAICNVLMYTVIMQSK